MNAKVKAILASAKKQNEAVEKALPSFKVKSGKRVLFCSCDKAQAVEWGKKCSNKDRYVESPEGRIVHLFN